MSSRVLGYVRQPEYTGANRCLPCTAVNVGIAIVLAAGIAWVSPPIGVAFLILAVAAIALRGYLVPYTPELTARYLPERIHRLFGHESSMREGEADVELERQLIEWGVLEPCADEDDLCLRPAIRERFRDRLEDLREDWVDHGAIASLFDAEAEDVRLARTEPPIVAVHGRRNKWPSGPALMADAAMAEVLDATVRAWEEAPVEERGPLLAGLRPFLDACPGCDGAVALNDDEVYESCCRRKDVMRLECTECGAAIFEVDAEAIAAVEEDTSSA